MSFKTSEVVVCCSNALCNSRVSRATFVSRSAWEELWRRMTFGGLRRFSVNVLRLRALTALPICFVALFQFFPQGSGKCIVACQKGRLKGGARGRLAAMDVRIGSRTDVTLFNDHVRFTLNNRHLLGRRVESIAHDETARVHRSPQPGFIPLAFITAVAAGVVR